MALSIDTTPDAIQAVNNPIVFVVSSDLDEPFQSMNNNGISDNGSGKVRFTFASAHPFTDGETGKGSSFGYDALNDVFTITVVDAVTIDIDVNWSSSYTGETGSIQQWNLNFQVKAEVIVDSATIGTLVKRSYDTGGNYRFDISSILQSIISYDLPEFGASNITSPASSEAIKEYTVKFTELFDDKNGLQIEGADTTSSAYLALNAAHQPDEVQDLDDYIMNSSADKFLTDSPRTVHIQRGDEIQFSFLTDKAEVRLYYLPYDLDGNSIGNQYLTKVTINNKRGVVSINDNIYTDSHSKIQFRICDESLPGTFYSETITVIIDPVCNSDKIWFLNPKGGFDHFDFKGSKHEDQEVKRNIYTKGLGLTFTKTDRGKAVAEISSEIKFTRFSDSLDDETARWLEDLYDSPEIYLQDGSDLYSIVVVNESVKLHESDEITQQSIEYYKSQTKIRQR